MIAGNIQSGQVTINGKPLNPGPSQTLINHSPDGFSWGYGGSGPAQLALALLLHYTDRAFAMGHYQNFKFEVIAGLPQEDFKLPFKRVKEWVTDNGYSKWQRGYV